MKSLFVKAAFFCLIFFLSSCEKKEIIPNCIALKIKEYIAASPEYRRVYLYNFDQKDAYLFQDFFPDSTYEVYDKNCNKICTLGGFIGATTCEGKNFFMNSKLVRELGQ
jgi:hypothetical protein